MEALECAWLFAKGRKGSQWGEEVRAVGEVDAEGFGLARHDLNAFVRACQATTPKQQGALDGFVGLGVGAVQAFHIQVMGSA